MQSQNFPLENVILVFGFVGSVCWCVGMATGIRVIENIGAAMVAVLVVPALLLTPVMLTMRVFGIGCRSTSRPAEKDATGAEKKEGGG